ncbi:hypothetical protein TNCV_3037601 [Trichonephila clavipes]|nr:hypothetical protein TNCV_3037601 [Trichonephila clavipes]
MAQSSSKVINWSRFTGLEEYGSVSFYTKLIVANTPVWFNTGTNKHISTAKKDRTSLKVFSFKPHFFIITSFFFITVFKFERAFGSLSIMPNPKISVH